MPDLQTTWFLLVGVLIAGYAVLDGFDLGVGMLHFVVGKDEGERRVLLNAVGPVWDGNEVWLLTAGGALFAAFPAVYATVFSGFYLALMLLLLALVARAVALEFRGKEDGPGWRRTWDLAFSFGSSLAGLLLGVAIGNVMRGLPLAPDGEFAGTFLGLLNPFALAVGALAVAMFAMQGAAWLLLKTEGVLARRARVAAYGAFSAFVASWLVVTVVSRTAAPHLWDGFTWRGAFAAPVALVGAVVLFPIAVRAGRAGLAFLASSTAIVALVALLGLGLYPALVPALGGGTPLDAYNSSSSEYTLGVMRGIALVGMPLVIGYTIFIYRRFRGPVVIDEHSY